MNWAHTGTAVSAAFLASLVEFVEALTIVLAVGAAIRNKDKKMRRGELP